MPGPYDIYEQQPSHHSQFLPDLSSFFSSGIGMGATFAAEMFVIPRMMNKEKMLRAVSTGASGHAAMMNDVRALTGGTSQAHFGNWVRGVGDKGFMRRGGSTMSKALSGPTIEAAFGRTAARRIGIGKLAAGFSRFGMMYAAVEIGGALGGMIGDAILNYEPKRTTNRRRELETGGAFVDTRFAQTQRQRAIQAIHNTQLSTRAALGNEAAFVHMER